MKKLIVSVWVTFAICCTTSAQMIFLEGQGSGTLTTGDLLDGADNTGITTNVLEIPGLEVSARSGAPDQDINTTVDSLGITIFNSGDDTDAFDVGEKLILSFDLDVQINRLDFNQFDEGESITVVIGGDESEILYLELTHKGSDYLDTNLVVAAYTEIEFYTTGESTVGLDGIDVTVLESTLALELSLSNSNGMAYVVAVFNGIPSSNYLLQYKSNLADTNGWDTVSAPFGINSNWQFDSTNSAGFYRAISQ